MRQIEEALKSPNMQAFLMTIRHAEGTDDDNGYCMLFGGSMFPNFKDHPRIKVHRMSRGKSIVSSAAGAYQILQSTWDGIRDILGLSNFSPENQDRAAVYLIRRRGALEMVLKGEFVNALAACKKEWASLPGAGYGQPEKQVEVLRAVYLKEGGAISHE
jgi:muramidase (phage lysozyme)